MYRLVEVIKTVHSQLTVDAESHSVKTSQSQVSARKIPCWKSTKSCSNSMLSWELWQTILTPISSLCKGKKSKLSLTPFLILTMLKKTQSLYEAHSPAWDDNDFWRFGMTMLQLHFWSSCVLHIGGNESCQRGWHWCPDDSRKARNPYTW